MLQQLDRFVVGVPAQTCQTVELLESDFYVVKYYSYLAPNLFCVTPSNLLSGAVVYMLAIKFDRSVLVWGRPNRGPMTSYVEMYQDNPGQKSQPPGAILGLPG
jgi:hypothetical protein